MTEPKFHVGQKVAVLSGLTYPPLTVIPETVVTGMTFDCAGFYINSGGVRYWSDDEWSYYVTGETSRFAEHCLRPLFDDDYKDELTDTLPANKVQQ